MIRIVEENENGIVSEIEASTMPDTKYYCFDTDEPTATLQFTSREGNEIFITIDYRTLTKLKYEADNSHVAPF